MSMTTTHPFVPLSGPARPASQAIQAYRISLPEEVLDALQQQLSSSASASASLSGTGTEGINITFDGPAKGLSVGGTHFPFSSARDLSQDLYTRLPSSSSATAGAGGALTHLGSIRRDLTIQRQLNPKALQKVQARSHQVEDERKGRKAILLEDVPGDVENAAGGKRGKKVHAHAQAQAAAAHKAQVGRRLPPPAPAARPAPSSAPVSKVGLQGPKPAGSTSSTPRAPVLPKAGLAGQSGTTTPQAQHTGGKSPLLTKIIHRLAHKSHTLKDLSKLIGAPKPEISKLLSKVAWTIGSATNPDNTVWSLRDDSWLSVDLYSPVVTPPWSPGDRERIYNETLAAFRRLNLPDEAPERKRLALGYARMKGLPPPVPAVQEKEKQAITVTPTPASKVKPAPAAADQPQLQPKPASAPPSQAGPMLTSAGLQIGATLSSSFRGGLSKKEGKSRPGKVEPAAKAAKGEKAQRESEKERKAREDMEEGELEDELAPPPLPAPVPAPSAARPLAPPAATRSKLPPFSKVTPAKVDPPAYDKPTVSSASKQKPAKAALPARVDTPDRDRAGPSTSGSVSRHAARPSLDARVAGEAPSRPTSAMGSKPRTLEVLKGKEPELRKRPAAKDAEEDHDVEEGRVGKKRKTEDKLPLKRGEKVRIAAKDERAAVVRVTTTAPARKEREELKGKAVARKDDEPKSLARKDDSSLERRLARKDDSSLERKPLPKEKKDVLPERRAEIKSKKADLPERKSAAKRKMVDYSDDESDVPIAKKQKPAAVPAKEPEARARPSTVVLVKSKVVARPANAESTKREAAKLAAVDKGKRKRPDYTSSEDERDEPEERPTVRRKTASSAPLPPAASKAQPAPAPAPTPRQRAPPTQGELLIKSLRLYAEYVEIHAKIVQQKQVYEDFAAGKKNEPKMMAPEKMEKVVAEYEKIHTELIDLHTKMDEMAVAPAVSAAPAASKA